MAQPRIVVIGSSNIDMIVKSERIPQAGETVLGGSFAMVPGGKGANQAVCAAKLGADVTLVARIGTDVFGDMSVDNFRAVGIDTSYIVRDSDAASGVALITVDKRAENAIVVAPGANGKLAPEDVDRARDVIASADCMLVQLEIPMETVTHSINLAASLGTRVVLNPAPARPINTDILRMINVLVPNQHEAAQLLDDIETGNSLNPESAAEKLKRLGVDSVVITLGSKGAYVASNGVSEYIEPIKVEALDTTAAGDAFTAAMTLKLAEGCSLVEAARFGARVAAIAVTRMGAQSSLPTLEEVNGN